MHGRSWLHEDLQRTFCLGCLEPHSLLWGFISSSWMQSIHCYQPPAAAVHSAAPKRCSQLTMMVSILSLYWWRLLLALRIWAMMNPFMTANMTATCRQAQIMVAGK